VPPRGSDLAVHLLCDNAGLGTAGSVWESTVADWEWAMGVNLRGVIHGVRVFVPIMLVQDIECHIVNTSPAARILSGPGLANFLRQLVLPKPIQGWTLTTLREKLVKIRAKVVSHAKYLVFQLAEVAVPRQLFVPLLERIGRLRLARASG
jgi:NAD(P)-dependent dehydrogenase (short-subunit alcohol dehydrogenase family)